MTIKYDYTCLQFISRTEYNNIEINVNIRIITPSCASNVSLILLITNVTPVILIITNGSFDGWGQMVAQRHKVGICTITKNFVVE